MAVELYEAVTAIVTSHRLPDHGRHPNFNLLLKGDRMSATTAAAYQRSLKAAPSSAATRQQVRVDRVDDDEASSICKKPYVYIFSGRKWPKSVFQRALCESASYDAVSPTPPTHLATLDGKTVSSSSKPVVMVCKRYEIVGTPVIVERFQINENESLCRMFCSTTTDNDTRLGKAVSHLEGAPAASLVTMLLLTTQPMLHAEEGIRDASWSDFTNSLASDDRSTSSASCGASASTCGSSVDNNNNINNVTPLREPSALSTASSYSQSPQVAVVSLESSKGFQLASLHTSCITVFRERETTTYSFPSPNAVLDGWAAWRCGDVPQLDRRSIMSSMDEIMTVNRCSRTSFFRCVSLLDRYVAVSHLRSIRSSTSRQPVSSKFIRCTIAAAISVASKITDIFGIPVRSLADSLGKDIFSPEALGGSRRQWMTELEKMETSFLQELQFLLNPLTAEEVAESLLELHFSHTSTPLEQLQPCVRRSVAVCRCLLDHASRASLATTCSPLMLGVAVVKYTQQLTLDAHWFAREMADFRNIGLLDAECNHRPQELLRCMEVVRQCHMHAIARPVEMLERRYGTNAQLGVAISLAQFAPLQMLSEQHPSSTISS